MKNKVIELVGLFSLVIVGVASATTYLDVNDFTSSGTYLDRTYSEFSDSNNDGYFGLYTHTVDFNPGADSVQNASLTLEYAFVDNSQIGNPPILKEIYLFYDENAQQIGSLAGHGDKLWHTAIFYLDSYTEGISGTNWAIGFQFQETTNGNDKFYLDKSILLGDYTPVTNGEPIPSIASALVPEPSTLLLMSSGFIGLTFVIRRRRKE
jgi:hypothetical protein